MSPMTLAILALAVLMLYSAYTGNNPLDEIKGIVQPAKKTKGK